MTGEPATATLDYTIPERSGEVLIAPGFDRVPELLAASRAVAWDGVEVLGVPLAEFRRRVRARALRLAADYTGGTASDPAQALVVMGHQPVLFHPGVWVKYFLLTRIARETRAAGLHLIVDTDATGPIGADVPAQHDRLVRVRETLADLPGDVPLEAAAIPDAAAWAGFLDRMRGHLGTVPVPGLRAHLDTWARGEREARASRHLGGFLSRLRRGYEAGAGAPGYLELPMSALAETPEFRAFALHLLREPDVLRRSYNGQLDAYRRLRRLRSPANPFPNLAEEGDRIEAPFWVVREGRRSELYVSRAGGRLELSTSSGSVATVPADASGADALAEAGVALRPKAITLTMFTRLCVGDLFIHGVGGGRYDRVTDAITADLFGCRPVPYLVATATLHLSLPAEASGEERRRLERLQSDFRHNPDRHLENVTEAQRRLVDEKWYLIREVETMRPGPGRRAATRRIREINAELASHLAPDRARVEARLAALDGADAGGAAGYRDYPFFLFDPVEVAALAGIPEPAN
ncbi:MAG TPA: hypothetical protein VEZ44_11835 [bacterium]|nr:hypothetical protein [bacterium]